MTFQNLIGMFQLKFPLNTFFPIENYDISLKAKKNQIAFNTVLIIFC